MFLFASAYQIIVKLILTQWSVPFVMGKLSWRSIKKNHRCQWCRKVTKWAHDSGWDLFSQGLLLALVRIISLEPFLRIDLRGTVASTVLLRAIKLQVCSMINPLAVDETRGWVDVDVVLVLLLTCCIDRDRAVVIIKHLQNSFMRRKFCRVTVGSDSKGY